MEKKKKESERLCHVLFTAVVLLLLLLLLPRTYRPPNKANDDHSFLCPPASEFKEFKDNFLSSYVEDRKKKVEIAVLVDIGTTHLWPDHFPRCSCHTFGITGKGQHISDLDQHEHIHSILLTNTYFVYILALVSASANINAPRRKEKRLAL